jgi:hypothetical protein
LGDGGLALSLAESLGDTAILVWTSVALGRQHFAVGGNRLGVERRSAAVENSGSGGSRTAFRAGDLAAARGGADLAGALTRAARPANAGTRRGPSI